MDVDDSAGELNDAIGSREPKTSSALALGREERLEHAAPCLLVHARSRVGHFDLDGPVVESVGIDGSSARGMNFAITAMVPPAGMASRAFKTILSRT